MVSTAWIPASSKCVSVKAEMAEEAAVVAQPIIPIQSKKVARSAYRWLYIYTFQRGIAQTLVRQLGLGPVDVCRSCGRCISPIIPSKWLSHLLYHRDFTTAAHDVHHAAYYCLLMHTEPHYKYREHFVRGEKKHNIIRKCWHLNSISLKMIISVLN